MTQELYGKPYPGLGITQITDTTDSRAKGKVRHAYVNHAARLGLHGDIEVRGAKNDVKIGTAAAELLTNRERPEYLFVAVNYAPPDNPNGTKDNARNDFYFADLGNKAFIGGTNNGYELSYVKPKIQSLFRLTTTNKKKSQFRSLEILPQYLLAFPNEKLREDLLKSGELVEVKDIDKAVPSVPDVTHVYEVDNFRNVKLYVSDSDRRLIQKLAGQVNGSRLGGGLTVQFSDAKLEVTQNSGNTCDIGSEFKASATETLFAAPLGTDLVALRSSSTLPSGGDVPIIATMRLAPAETRPNYRVPRVGNLVRLTGAQQQYAVA
ncbi:MAG: hypothetical protein WDO70_11465 [Alphaproteobacteria bacterium]